MNSNEMYFSAAGKCIAPKSFQDSRCPCTNKCHTVISAELRRKIFEHFWSLGDYNVQTTFISTYIVEKDIKRKTSNDSSPGKRSFTRIYLIHKVQVCREMFIKTLGVSTKRINTALRKVRNLTIPDKRGTAGGHNKMPSDLRNGVIEHIRKFPRYKSHYCRAKNDQQEYLPIGVTTGVMYRLYKDENPDKHVSFSSYKRIFLTVFNLKTKRPQKDTCNKCDLYQAKIGNCQGIQKETLSLQQKTHLEEAETARARLKRDFIRAAGEAETETLSFDMEKTLPLPRLTTNIIFYKRQLWLYNCGFYGGKNKNSVSNIWLEGEAGHGAQEIGSCLRKYIHSCVDKSVKDLILWSDSCGGQNRNIKVVLLLETILQESNTLKLYTPDDYIEIMETCRKKNPIRAHRMNREDFVSSRKLEKDITNRKKNANDEKINWLSIREIKIVKELPFAIFIKTTYSEEVEYQEINIEKGKKGRQSKTAEEVFRKLEALWPEGKPVSQEKLDDIKSYLDLIPKADQQFYTKLSGDPDIVEDIEGYNGELDFMIEEEPLD